MPVVPSRSQRSQYGAVNRVARVGRQPPPPPIVLQRGPVQGIEQTGDRQLLRIQQSIVQATQQAKANPFAESMILEGLTLLEGVNLVGHGLPQAWRGALLTTPSAAVTWYVTQLTPAALNDTRLQITVSAQVTCSLVVW